MATSVTVALLNDGSTALSSATNGSGVANGGPATVGSITTEAIAICNCSAINTNGSFTIKIQGSTDAGATWTDLVSMGTIAAKGLTLRRIEAVAPLLRWISSNKAGTSITAAIMVVGLVPTDSTNETPMPSTTGVGTLLQMEKQPSTTVESEAISPAVTVNVCDYLGNVCTGDSATSVTVAILGTPAGVTLGGTKTVTASSGLATFSDLTIDTPDAYRLLFTATGLTSVQSAPVVITAD